MTRFRVLQRAIKLLQAGFHPYDGRGMAYDKDDNCVAHTHPDAVLFNATGAVARAIFDFTGETVKERQSLWSASMDNFRNKYGGWTPMYNAFERMSKDEIIALFQAQLDDWDNL